MATSLETMLEREEGREHNAYPDPLTHGDPWTIGVGHTGPEVHPGLTWDDDQITAALTADIAKAKAFCEKHFNPWYQQSMDAVRRAVLEAMVFQMGGRVLEFKLALAAMRDQHWAHAAAEMLDSTWAKQTPKRAGRMARQMETGMWQ